MSALIFAPHTSLCYIRQNAEIFDKKFWRFLLEIKKTVCNFALTNGGIAQLVRASDS